MVGGPGARSSLHEGLKRSTQKTIDRSRMTPRISLKPSAPTTRSSSKLRFPGPKEGAESAALAQLCEKYQLLCKHAGRRELCQIHR